MRKTELAMAVPAAAAVLALAQPALAVVTIVASSYVERLSDSCSAGPECTLRLGAIPSGTTVVVRQISCNWTVAGSGLMTRISFRATNSGGTVLAFADYPLSLVELQAKSANIPIYNTEFGMTLAAGMVPRIVFTADTKGAQTYNCTMAATKL